MKLNNYSYVHKQIRALCFLFEQSTGLKLLTDLSADFQDIRFASPLSYVTINFKRNTLFVMCIVLKKEQKEMLFEILTYLRWLLNGQKVLKICQKATRQKK